MGSTAKPSTIRKIFPATSDSPQVAPHFCQFDPLVQTYKTGYLRGCNRNPIQRAERWWVLHTNTGLRAAVEKPRPLALSGVFCRWIGIGVTSVAAAIVTCHEVDVQKRAR